MKLLIEGTNIIGYMPSHPDAIEVEVPADFDTLEKPMWAWDYIGNTVVFNQSRVDAAGIEAQKEEYQAYLDSTDWYVVRFMERNKPIPEDVSAARLEAINFIDNN